MALEAGGQPTEQEINDSTADEDGAATQVTVVEHAQAPIAPREAGAEHQSIKTKTVSTMESRRAAALKAVAGKDIVNDEEGEFYDDVQDQGQENQGQNQEVKTAVELFKKEDAPQPPVPAPKTEPNLALDKSWENLVKNERATRQLQNEAKKREQEIADRERRLASFEQKQSEMARLKAENPLEFAKLEGLDINRINDAILGKENPSLKDIEARIAAQTQALQDRLAKIEQKEMQQKYNEHINSFASQVKEVVKSKNLDWLEAWGDTTMGIEKIGANIYAEHYSANKDFLSPAEVVDILEKDARDRYSRFEAFVLKKHGITPKTSVAPTGAQPKLMQTKTLTNGASAASTTTPRQSMSREEKKILLAKKYDIVKEDE